MDDEECLLENSSLNVYLQDLGFSDVQVSKKVAQKSSNIKFEVSKPKTKWHQVEKIDEDVIDQIGIIISTQLLFEEDILSIEKFLSNFEVVKTDMLKSIFKDLFGFGIIFLGLCLYWIIGYFAFFFVSSFYAYNAAYYLKRKYFYKIRLKKLSSIIQSNFTLLKKTVDFIEENKLNESKGQSFNNSGEFLQGFDLYKNFKNDFLLSVNEMINIFMTSTQKLIYKVPLYDYIENPEYYLCNNYKKNYETSSLSKLYDIYLLLQSEFLQRLILSLIPNIKSSGKDDFNEINEVISETCLGLLKIKKVINKKFKFVFFNGIHSPNNKVKLKFPKTSEISGNAYIKEFLLNIHETSKNFQNLLIRCRMLEDSIKSEKLPDFVENELIKMQSNMNSCQRNLSDCLILLKKSNALTEKQDNVSTIQKSDDFGDSNEKLNKIEIGYPDLDPKIEDEIFEAFFSNENTGSTDEDYWDLEDRLKEKLGKENYKSLMKELKVKLLEKSKHWKIRERELLKKKGLIDMSENMSENDETNENKSSSVEILDDFNSGGGNLSFQETKIQNFNNDLEKFDSLKGEKLDLRNFTFETKEPSCNSEDVQNDLVSGKNHLDSIALENSEDAKDAQGELTTLKPEYSGSEKIQNLAVAFKTDFLNDLNKTRQKIFKSSFTVDEELFCDAAEDDSS